MSEKIFRATFDVEGFPTGFYPDDIWPSGYPAEAVEVSEAQWLEFISNAGLRKWADGQVVEHVPTPSTPVIPDRVSSRQFFMMLDKMDATTNPGIYDQVNGWVASQPRAIRLVYEKAGSFVRADEMLQQGFVALGFTSDQVDAFFKSAAAL
ncbi:MAG TPA: hypothetical protein VHP34_11500 [Alphaproteobacteria bacterium]|nr:hypothetical protein [Alphaproteobacteria bacterium]